MIHQNLLLRFLNDSFSLDCVRSLSLLKYRISFRIELKILYIFA